LALETPEGLAALTWLIQNQRLTAKLGADARHQSDSCDWNDGSRTGRRSLPLKTRRLMFEHLIFSPSVLNPEEASILHEAVHEAISKISAARAMNDEDCKLLAGDIIRIAKSGYTRTPEGKLDPHGLADAAVTRFLSFTAG
jgi:hypothetical protein